MVANATVHATIDESLILVYYLKYQSPPCHNCTLGDWFFPRPSDVGAAMATRPDPYIIPATPPSSNFPMTVGISIGGIILSRRYSNLKLLLRDVL